MATKSAFAEGSSRPPSRVRTRAETQADTLEDHGILLRHLILTINGGKDEDGDDVQGLNHFLRSGLPQIYNQLLTMRGEIQTLQTQLEETKKLVAEQKSKNPFTTPPNAPPKPEDPTPRQGGTWEKLRTTTPPFATKRDPSPIHPPFPRGRTHHRHPSSHRSASVQEQSPPRQRNYSPKSKIPKPDAYEGKRGSSAKQYFTKVLAYFDAHRRSFPNDREKINFLLSNMGEGTAAAWAQPFLEKLVNHEDHPYIQSLANFQKVFLINFGDPSAEIEADRRIRRLTQKASAADYATEFRTLALELKWDESALISQFQQGLKDEVRREIIKLSILQTEQDRKDLTLEGYITMCIHLDSTLYQARKGRQSEGGHWRSNEGGKKENPVSGKLGTTSGTQKEKDMRSKEGLCVKCGKGKHKAAVCNTGW